ncbi:hypothetical protein [Cytobacillus gottheilii]|uniref:hypothetical protein n=1 Tax=Cytobacillus gottheilii TaxID=859144 RepID=UPI0009BBA97F|nr:hypothetical protein [Cytobacillus gottheilii]
MKKDIIFFKLIAKQKSIIPIVLLTSIGMGILHRNIENSLLLNITWALILSGVILLLNQKALINWGNKPLFQKIKEGSLILFGSFLVLLIPIHIIVMIGLFLVQIYLVTVLSESGDESTPFIKRRFTAVRLSDEERKNFNISQKLNYPEPDSEIELAIMQNELKMQEILQAKEDLEKHIFNKESEIQKMQSVMENSQDYKYIKSLKETIEKTEKEKDNLVNKRAKLMHDKQSLEEQLYIQKIKLDKQQLITEKLKKEQIELKEDLQKKKENLLMEQKKKDKLELKQKRLSDTLNERYKEIQALNKVRNNLENEKRKTYKEINEITDELNKTREKQKKYEEDLDTVKRENEKLRNNYKEEKEKIQLELEKLSKQKEAIEQSYTETSIKLSNTENQNLSYRKEKEQLSKDVDYLQREVSKLSEEQRFELEDKQKRISELELLIAEKAKNEEIYNLKLQTIKEEKEKVQSDYELYREIKEQELYRLKVKIDFKDKQEGLLKDELNDYKESLEALKSSEENLVFEIGTLNSKIETKNKEVFDYKQQLETLEYDKKQLEKKHYENQKEIEALSEVLEEYKNGKEQILKEVDIKEKIIVTLARDTQILIHETRELKERIDEKEKEINENWDLINSIDEENKELNDKRFAFIEKQQKIEELEATVIALNGEKEGLLSEYRKLKSDVQQAVAPYPTPRVILTSKAELKFRFKELYSELSFSESFVNSVKKLNKKEQVSIEKQLLYLNFDSEKLKKRPNSIIINKGSAVEEYEYEQKDRKGIGTGRIYVRGKRIIALSTDKEEQTRVIQKIKSGELN